MFERIPRVAITAAVAAGLMTISLMTISLTTAAGASQAATGTPAWQSVAAPKAFIDSPAFTSVTAVAASPSDAWIFAGTGATPGKQRTTVLRRTGKSWSAGAPKTLNAVVSTAVALRDNDVWAFGETTLATGAIGRPYAAHDDGSTWSPVPFPLFGVDASATSSSDVWVIGAPAKESSPGVAVGITRFNGQAWVATPLPDLGLTSKQVALATGIVAASPSNVWADGVIEIPPATVTAIPRQTPFLLHWNGTRWSKVTVPYSAQFAPSNGTIAQDGHGGVWLSVQGSGAKPPAALLHYRDGTWTRFSVPATRGDLDLPGVLAWIPGTRSVWGIGSEEPVTAAGDFDAVILKYGA